MSNSIENKTALVTGANRGIGKAIVESLLAKGAAKVYLAVRDVESAGSLVAHYGDRVEPVRLDVTDNETVKAAAARASDVDIVVNNAGVFTITGPLDANAIESLSYEMDINVHGLIRMAQAFAPVLKANGGGTFAQLNSVASIKTFNDFTTYSASKAASYAVTQALRDALAEQGTEVVSVHPGPVATDMGKEAGFEEGAATPAPVVADSIVAAIENGQFHAFTDDMARMIGSAYDSYAENIVNVNLMEG